MVLYKSTTGGKFQHNFTSGGKERAFQNGFRSTFLLEVLPPLVADWPSSRHLLYVSCFRDVDPQGKHLH
jgi:hypothetical protein